MYDDDYEDEDDYDFIDDDDGDYSDYDNGCDCEICTTLREELG